MLLDFGQPSDGLVQFAYTVEDIYMAAQYWTDLTGIGPWFIRGPFTTMAKYRGEPSRTRLLVAQAFNGHAMIELIQQLDESDSVYREQILEKGHGYHHSALATLNFDEKLADLSSFGLQISYESVLPTGARLVYLDTSTQLGGMLELVEINAAQEAVYSNVYYASQGWDGRDLFRTH